MRDRNKPGCTAVLHNVRSVYNVGSVFRTADAAGVAEIVLSGYTPRPLDRFGRPRPDLAKVSLGAEQSVPWRAFATLAAALAYLRGNGAVIVAIEQDPRAVSLFDWKPDLNAPLGVVFGNEVRGLSKRALAQADRILEIPLRGKKESLNVSVAAGIALFELLENRSLK